MKRRTSRRLLSILMALCMVLTLLPVTAAADTIASGVCGAASIGNNAFFGCEGLTGVTIGEGITTIGWETFELCASLTSVTIPVSVTAIEPLAFSTCDSLTGVYYGGSEDQWEQINIDFGNDQLLNAYIQWRTHNVDPDR